MIKLKHNNRCIHLSTYQNEGDTPHRVLEGNAQACYKGQHTHIHVGIELTNITFLFFSFLCHPRTQMCKTPILYTRQCLKEVLTP